MTYDDTEDMIDIEAGIAPKSDQINSDDLMIGPRTVTITGLRKGSGAQQPWHIVTDYYGPKRPYKPCLTMRRVIVKVWGTDARKWIGQSFTIFRDERVTFGKTEGGIRISHMTGIDRKRSIPVRVKRGENGKWPVEPLVTPVAPEGPEPITTAQQSDIRTHMARTGATWGDVVGYASKATGRELPGTSALAELTHAEADRLITALAELPEAHPEDHVTFPEDEEIGASVGNPA